MIPPTPIPLSVVQVQAQGKERMSTRLEPASMLTSFVTAPIAPLVMTREVQVRHLCLLKDDDTAKNAHSFQNHVNSISG